ncbi:CHASE2 domain-containing protein [Pseudodesulfovibrio senegalensis]|uniref:Adenylate/guanylate cyclase domain-containing protein n=1 Tax=Pseudodesulfovibrio senegalensis TaxID=1721087 RepID=A0A6N6N6N9_9BACT|nr:adenylate/guanylate cyclase domain-containing protein [Pseudodesulfovibrio senegalensis]KAB1443734.1 adenylate/guanylate cyclase domain-containing protein [Pseudodesulfovibrio senegalensis]
MKKSLKTERMLIPATGFMLSCITVLLFIIQPSFLRLLDYKVYDQLLIASHSPKATDVPVIVDIDEKSLQQFGQWPWPRYRVALLLGTLQNMGARSVATDIIFAEPDNTSLAVLRAQLKRDLHVDLHFSGIPHQLVDNDTVLANLLSLGPFVFGMDMDFAEQPQKKPSQSACARHAEKVILLATHNAPPLNKALHEATGIICPLEQLAHNAPALGFITIAADEDGLFRRVPLLIACQDAIYPSLALAALKQAFGTRSVAVKLSSLGVESIRLGQQEIPVDKKGQMLINYRGPSHTFNYISAADIINGSVPNSSIQNKIVFIGTSASGLRDLRPTPLDTYYPGVETHATIVDNILSGQFLVDPDWGPGAVLVAIVVTGMITTLLVGWAKGIWVPLPLAALALGLWLGAKSLFENKGLYVSPLYPYINLALSFTLLVVIKFWREERDKRFIQGAFSHYVAPAVVRRIVNDPSSLSLEGMETDVTIQFSDIRGFTTLSEKLSPTQVTALLHDYMTPMTEIITRHSGTLDKFIGDAIMAFWNAPIAIPGHQDLAVQAALAQLERLDVLNKAFETEYGLTMEIGIGLHAGVVRVGNMGSKDLFDYTIIGDTVNLASRLESLCKYYGQKIVVSQSIVDGCRNSHVFLELDRVRVKGKKSAVTVYTVATTSQAQKRAEEFEMYQQALNAYHEGNFEHAESIFRQLTDRFSDCRLYTLYLERCKGLQRNPPLEWDGIFTHTEK